MSVDALDLKPRGPIALFDAAVRVCATSSIVWALTLPAGAALVAAAFVTAEAAQRQEPLHGPAALLTAAWALRAICQGAACHALERQLVGPDEPTAWASLRAGLARAPSLIVTSVVVAAWNLALWLFTAGIGFFFFGAHAAAYATCMRGQGGALRVYGTAARLLGPARHTAAWVRLCGLTQLLVAVNLHLFVALSLYLGRVVLGLDLTFVDRFASADNPVWLATLGVVTFALFEPLRAATGALLLVDGRVRQEGLDLLAAVEQLPRRRARRVSPAVAALLCSVWLGAGEAQASALRDRVGELLEQCASEDAAALPLDALDALAASEQASLSRFVSRLERRAYDAEDCEGAVEALRAGLAAMTGARPAAENDAATARDDARAILARPEFRAPVEPAQDTAADDKGPSWLGQQWGALWRALWEWLRAKEPRDAPTPSLPSGAQAMAGANVVMVVAIAAIVGTLLFILLRGVRRPGAAEAPLDERGAVSEEALTSDPMSALSRPPEGWAGLADQLAAKGQFREAIRHLYLALLARLHRDGAITYDPTWSNWEYLSAFKGPSQLKLPFRELTRRFDFVWYGNLDATAASYAVFRTTAGPLLAPGGEGERARA
jgi:hypothetical protein